MAFFAGDLDGRNGHDDLAKQIADNGKDYATRFWRYEDMEACASSPLFFSFLRSTLRGAGPPPCVADPTSLARLLPPRARVGSCQLCAPSPRSVRGTGCLTRRDRQLIPEPTCSARPSEHGLQGSRRVGVSSRGLCEGHGGRAHEGEVGRICISRSSRTCCSRIAVLFTCTLGFGNANRGHSSRYNTLVGSVYEGRGQARPKGPLSCAARARHFCESSNNVSDREQSKRETKPGTHRRSSKNSR